MEVQVQEHDYIAKDLAISEGPSLNKALQRGTPDQTHAGPSRLLCCLSAHSCVPVTRLQDRTAHVLCMPVAQLAAPGQLLCESNSLSFLSMSRSAAAGQQRG